MPTTLKEEADLLLAAMRRAIELGGKVHPMVVLLMDESAKKDGKVIRPIMMLDFNSDEDKERSIQEARHVIRQVYETKKLKGFLFVADASIMVLKSNPEETYDEAMARYEELRKKVGHLGEMLEAKDCLVVNAFSTTGERLLIGQTYLTVGKGDELEVIWEDVTEGSDQSQFKSNLWDGIF